MKSNFAEIAVDFVGARVGGPREFGRLYRRRIDRADRVRPRAILQWLKRPEQSATGREQFARLAGSERAQPCHVLLGAWERRRMVGFANLIYLPSVKAGFVPYFAVDRQQGDPAAVTRELLAALRALEGAAQPGLDWLIFECSHQDVRAAQARRRLFTRYLAQLGWELGKLEMSYRLPGLHFSTGGLEGWEADLMVARRSTTAAERPALSRAEVLKLLHAIYFDVYADGLARGPEGRRYRERLALELERLGHELPETVELSGGVSLRPAH